MKAPLSGKQQREDLKFLFDELRKTVAQRKEQRRKDQAHNQKMKQSDEKHMQKMDIPVPPMMGRPMNPEAGPSDKIPALLTAGEAVIPKKAAQNPKNKPLIKAMVGEGRSDVNLSVPPKGFASGTTSVRGYADGTPYVDEWDSSNEQLPVMVTPQDLVRQSAYMPNQVVGGAVSQPSIPVPTQQPREPIQLVDNPDRNAAIQAVNTSMPEDYTDYKGPTMSQSDYYKQRDIAMRAVENNNPAQVPAMPPSPVATTKNVNVEVPPVVEYQPQASSSDQSISSRYNNPGNLRFGATYNAETQLWEDTGKRLDGQVSVDPKTGFAIFPNHELGRKALENQITLDTQTRGMTVEQFISKYAPASDKNDPKAYSNIIAKELGISSSDKITADQIPKVADIITRVEAGAKGYKPASFVPPKPEDNNTPSSANVPDDNKVISSDASKKVRTYGEAISSGIDNFMKTIKDPDALASSIGGFVKDTLGFSGQDAARFGLLVAGSRALGYNTTQAVRYAGNYTLMASDKRATATALAKSQMEQLGAKEAADLKKTLMAKGVTYKPDGTMVLPGFQAQKEMKQLTFDNGPYANKNFNMQLFKNPLSGVEIWRDTISGKTIEQLQAEAGNRSMTDYNSGTHSEQARAKAASQFFDEAGKNSEKILSNLGNITDDKNKVNPLRAGMPTGNTISTQVHNKMADLGYPITDVNNLMQMRQIVDNISTELVSNKQLQPSAKFPSVDSMVEKHIIQTKTGISNALFTSNNKPMPAGEVMKQVDAMTNLYRSQNKGMPEAQVNDKVMTTYAQLQAAWNATPALQEGWNKKASDKQSGFYLFTKDAIAKMK